MRAFFQQASEEVLRGDVRQRLDEILTREEFQWDRKSLLARVFDWLDELIDLPALPASWAGLEWILVAPLLALFVWSLLRLARYLRTLSGPAEHAPEDDTDHVARRVADLLAAARAARDAGDLRLALRRYFFALIVGLGGRGDLEYRDTWTHRELLERGHPTAAVSALLGPLVVDLDRKGFGRAATSEADVTRLAELCTRWLSVEGSVR